MNLPNLSSFNSTTQSWRVDKFRRQPEYSTGYVLPTYLQINICCKKLLMNIMIIILKIISLSCNQQASWYKYIIITEILILSELQLFLTSLAKILPNVDGNFYVKLWKFYTPESINTSPRIIPGYSRFKTCLRRLSVYPHEDFSPKFRYI